jgi:class 3 adenylate cyclase
LQTVNVVAITAWLRELGLERYELAFQENAIDIEVLPELTDADLEKLGVLLGHRRKLLRAIAELPEPFHAELAPSSEAKPSARALPRDAERRQLTVLFCDLVGSTELSAWLDPEDMGAVIGAYQECCAEVVKRWDGHVAKYMGDGMLAYFGWPRAHEDDAERAVRAGLELIEAVGKLKPEADLSLLARVGIATGRVVVGDLIGEGAAQEAAVVGDTPNLAARLQALAEPGAVVISSSTRRLVGGLFELTDLGPKSLKGFAEPLAAFRVEGEGRAEGRFEARQTTGLTPLVGREEEISLLLRRWRQASDGEGQVILLSGEPGIGKSRLVREVRGRLEGEPHIRLLYQCSPHHTTSPLHPVIEQLERAAGVERDDPPETRLDKLATLLAPGTGRLDEAIPLIAALLGIPPGERYPLPDLTSQRQKQRTLEVLVDQLDGLAAKQPVLLVYEDVHWIDPTTLDLLGLAIERVQRLAVLLLITFRSEFIPPWSGRPHVSALALTRLGRRDGAALVERVVREKTLPAEVSAQIVTKTDGVPLFVEELTKAVLESGLLRDAGDRYELSGPLPPLAIPSTLHDSLLARLDRLALVKEVAQIGAAIGREFSHALLAAVAERPEAELEAALDQLVSSELVFRRGAPPEATYSFKHALVRDAAYGTLLKSKRQHLHARIVQVLEERFPEAVQMQPELLAYHCTEAGLAEMAIDYWHKAGQRAIGRSAMAEAVAQLRMGLELLQGLPSAPDRDRREFHLQTSLGMALNHSRVKRPRRRAKPTAERTSCAGGSVRTSSSFPCSLVSGPFTQRERRMLRRLQRRRNC